LAKALKYRVEFYSKDGHLCQVDFRYEGYTAGIVYYLDGGARPFILKEFNSDDNLFKSIRPFLAEINIVTNSSSVTIDNFLADQDTDIEVRFYCANILYWSGFVLQDDFQEVYEEQNHVLTITASEALGLLKDRQLSDDGVEIEVKKTPLELIELCLQDTSKPLVDYTLINNLYHTSMSSTLPNTSLNQCLIDPRTFETSPRTYEDCYTVLDKINTAFNQTIFQYENRWVIQRIEDLYTSGNLRGYTKISGTSTSFNKRFDIEVGENSEIKPIAPQMLRFINRKPKETIVTFNFDRLAEVIRNSSFSRGALIATYPTEKWYEINNWTFIGVGSSVRKEIYESKFGALIDNYIQIPQYTGSLQILQSESVKVNVAEKIKLSIDCKFIVGFEGQRSIMEVKLIGGTNTYYLNEDGDWDTSSTYVEVLFLNADAKASEWNTIEVESFSLPETGELSVSLICPDTSLPSNTIFFKNLEFEILNRVDGFIEGLTGIESKFVKTQNIKSNNNYNLYLNDYISESYKGLIYEMDGETPTDFQWYRLRFSGEKQSFKKENAISYWSHNRYDRDKIDAAFYGLTWNDGGSTKVIGLANTIKLVDDLPNKIFYISNIKEIDFYNATWNCTMEEVWDTDRDGAAGPSRSLSLNVDTGTYPGIINVKYLPSSNPDFEVTGDDEIIYNGSETITENLTVTVAGNITAYTGATPVAVDFILKKNGVAIETRTISITTAAPFFYSINLSPASATTINPKDVFVVTFLATQIGKSIDGIQFIGGIFEVSSYNIPNELNYDPYTEKYLFR
jgi:hypothetical protein